MEKGNAISPVLCDEMKDEVTRKGLITYLAVSMRFED